MTEYQLFRKQTESIMTLLTETARDEIQKVFDCEKSASLTEIDEDVPPEIHDRHLKIVRFLCCFMSFTNKGFVS